jgi:3-oxoacyl-[acyl-carrier protein] reductase
MAKDAFPPEQIKQMVPAARAGTPEEVAALVGFLCGDAAGYINGQVIGIDGAMS